MSIEESKWHWGEGIKFAIEGMKTIFLLNGAAAVSVMTFMGNSDKKSHYLIASMCSFAIGAVSVVFSMLLSYVTQLRYGNASGYSFGDPAFRNIMDRALRSHVRVYFVIGVSIFLFVVGVALAARGLWF